jgi:flavin reductase (DIM6/NTAB) family NADH-FMN oxidoreductase RutF
MEITSSTSGTTRAPPLGVDGGLNVKVARFASSKIIPMMGRADRRGRGVRVPYASLRWTHAPPPWEKLTVPTSESSTLDPAARKTALRLFTYGLYAVGVSRGDDKNLFTANWLTQVSFDPPLIALSVEDDSHSIALLRDNGVFAISVFSSDDREKAGALGKRWELRPNKIDEVEYELGITGCPILTDALGAVECRVTGSMPAGDSTVFLGEVINAYVGREGIPLTMSAAGFRHAG